MEERPQAVKEGESKKTVRTFALASFFNDMGSEIIYPIWPLFVKSLGADMQMLGFIDGLGDAIVSISQAISGYISDRIRKRKVFIWLGYLCAAISRVGYAVSAVWQHLIPFRILDRAGKMRGAPRDAIIADVSTKENRGKNFGLLRAMDNLGAVCGILICLLFFYSVGANFQYLFWIAAIPSVIAMGLILFVIKERPVADARIFKGLTFRKIDPRFRLFLLLSVLFSLVAFSYSFLIIYAKEAGFSDAAVILLYLAFTAIAAIVSLPFGKLADRIGRKKTLQMGFLFWALLALCVIVAGAEKGAAADIKSFGFWGVILVFILYGLHKGALEPVQRAFVSELVPVEHRASGLGVYQMFVGLSALPASVLAGTLWDKVGRTTPFYLALVVTLAVTVMMEFVKEKREVKKPEVTQINQV